MSLLQAMEAHGVASQYFNWGTEVKRKNFFFLILVCEAIGTAATPGLLCQPRMIVKMIVEKQMECRLAEETEVLGENLPQRHFCPSQNPTWPDPVLNLGRRGGKPATNRLSYGAANARDFYQVVPRPWVESNPYLWTVKQEETLGNHIVGAIRSEM
jgi:hypothetical protein